MADAMKCDACNNYFDGTDDLIGDNAIRIGYRGSGSDGLDECSGLYDLCPNCMTKIYSIINLK